MRNIPLYSNFKIVHHLMASFFDKCKDYTLYTILSTLITSIVETKQSNQQQYQEANSVRYVGGYVCHSIKENLQSQPDSSLNQELLLALWELIEEEITPQSEAETHVMVLHTNRKFVTATPTSVTHGRTDTQVKS